MAKRLDYRKDFDKRNARASIAAEKDRERLLKSKLLDAHSSDVIDLPSLPSESNSSKSKVVLRWSDDLQKMIVIRDQIQTVPGFRYQRRRSKFN